MILQMMRGQIPTHHYCGATRTGIKADDSLVKEIPLGPDRDLGLKSFNAALV
jgi:hypothetical protein